MTDPANTNTTRVPGPPFRADHVGSLLRPAAVRRARQDLADGVIGAEALRQVEDEAVIELVRRQEEVGLRTATDGEIRRGSWQMDFVYQLSGIVPRESNSVRTWHGRDEPHEWRPPGLAVVDRISLDHTIFGADFAFVHEHVGTATAKLTIPSPNVVASLVGLAPQNIYEGDEALRADLVAAYADQLLRLAELGCTYLQLDETTFAHLVDPARRAQLRSAGVTPDEQLQTAIATLNQAIARRPAEMAITTHTCRGNYRSMWLSTGGYDPIAEMVFNELEVDGFFLEFDDSRSGSFAPLRFVPRGKRVVLGLVTTKRPELERQADLIRRIEDAARFIDIDQLCISPQCGFASTQEGNDLAYEDEWAKLRLIVETANRVWASS